MSSKSPSGRLRKGGKEGGKEGVKPRRTRSSKPPPLEETVDKHLAGRTTLSAIIREMQSGLPQARKPFVTIGYDERPLGDEDEGNKRHTPDASTDEADSTPEVTVSETRAGFETMAIIDEELLRDARELSKEERQSQFAKAEVLELLTFVIVDRALSSAATDEEKRAFVAERLWHRLPPGGIGSVRRIDVRPADQSALMMRVWCAVPKFSFE